MKIIDRRGKKLEIGDRVIVGEKYDGRATVHMAMIEDASEESLSLLMFGSSQLYRKTIKLRPRSDSKGSFWMVLKVNWEWELEDAKNFGTDDPSTLIKKRKPSKKKTKEFKAGDNEWMGENLSVRTFRNGDLVPIVTDVREWKECAKKGLPACCFYDNDESEYGTRGLLYNIHALEDPRTLIPSGWHLPSKMEYEELISLLGGPEKAGKRLKSQKGWYDGPFVTMSDFNGLPNGCREKDGKFEGEGYYGQWLIKSEDNTYSVMILRGENIDAPIFQLSESDKGIGYSIRCVKDNFKQKASIFKQMFVQLAEEGMAKKNFLDKLEDTPIDKKAYSKLIVYFAGYLFSVSDSVEWYKTILSIHGFKKMNDSYTTEVFFSNGQSQLRSVRVSESSKVNFALAKQSM